MSKGKIYHIVLEPVRIDFNNPHPKKAKFKLVVTDCPHQKRKCFETKLKYRAIIKDEFYFHCGKVCVHVDADGIFKFEIPPFVIGLEIILEVPNGCTDIWDCKSYMKFIEYFPSNCKQDFISDLSVTRQLLIYCNKVAIDTSGLDHTPVKPGESRHFGHQLGPCRAARAMAIVHIAMFEVFNVVHHHYKSYLNLNPDPSVGSPDAGIAQAMSDTLIYLFPSHQPRLSQILASILNQIPNSSMKNLSIQLGKIVALTIISLRQSDGSNHSEPKIGHNYFPSNAPGQWRQDPDSNNLVAVGGLWSQVRPFGMVSADQFRTPSPPDLTSTTYMMSFDEVKSYGGDSVKTPTIRSEIEKETGIFWAYDGTPSLCAPPRLYNQIVLKILGDQGVDTIKLFRTLAILNVVMADTALASWESKYFYNFWRPISAIREADGSGSPSGLTDGNAGTCADPTYTPMGAPATGTNELNFTPPFPSYPSGHAAFGGCVFQVLRNLFGTDNIAFTFVSDELNGTTKDNEGKIRPYKPRTYSNFSSAEEENGQSRIYLGIHFNFDKTFGITQGNEVANYIEERLYSPI